MFKKTNAQNVLGTSLASGAVLVQAQGPARVRVVMPPEPQLIPPAPINTLPSKNSYFKGRIETFEKIQKIIKDKSYAVLYGPGGIGKTSIAYEFAHKYDATVKVRIRTENIDTIKEDFKQLAVLLKIPVEERSLEELVPLVYQELDKTYSKGIIIFDNVDCYKNTIRSENTNKALTKFFPKDDKKFKVIITTRNKKYWDSASLVEIKGLDQSAATEIFKKISGLKEFSTDELIIFLHHTLGYLPLAICQAASYIKYHNFTLEQYIKLFEQADEAETLLADEESLPPELTFDGETPKIRQAIYKTYDLNIKAIVEADGSFLETLRYAALMSPDMIGQDELYRFCQTKFPDFQGRSFQSELEKTSLILFKDKDEKNDFARIDMHRITQLVLMLKIYKDEEKIKLMLSNLLSNFVESYLKNSVYYINFNYILRRITEEKLFYKTLELSNPLLIECLQEAADQYIKHKEIDAALEFLGKAIAHIKKEESPESFKSLQEKITEIFQKHFRLENLKEKWLVNLLKKIDTFYLDQIANSLLKKEIILTRNRGDMNVYYETVIALSNVIVATYSKLSALEDRQKEILAKAYYILGRSYCEQTKGLLTQLENCKSHIDRLANQKSTLARWKTNVHSNITSELSDLTSKLSNLQSDFDDSCESAKNNLVECFKIRKSLQQLEEIPGLLCCLQLAQLHKLKNLDKKFVRENFFKIIIKNQEKIKNKYPNSYDLLIKFCNEECSSLTKKRKETDANVGFFANNGKNEGKSVISKVTQHKFAKTR